MKETIYWSSLFKELVMYVITIKAPSLKHMWKVCSFFHVHSFSITNSTDDCILMTVKLSCGITIKWNIKHCNMLSTDVQLNNPCVVYFTRYKINKHPKVIKSMNQLEQSKWSRGSTWQNRKHDKLQNKRHGNMNITWNLKWMDEWSEF